MYAPWPDNNDEHALRSQLVNLLSDKENFAPSHGVADIHSQVAPVYVYGFARRPKPTLVAEWMGVPHAENVIYGYPWIPKFAPSYDEADRNVSLFIMVTYVNFARSGDLTPQPVSGVTWERFNSSHRAYLRVDANPKMAASFYPRRMAFWNDYYPKLTQMKFDTKEEIVASAGVTTATILQLVLTSIFEILAIF